ncbi:MAG: NlpC/P60 family protein, partial [Betaproteobacteria bacterium]|nr:NlpC/P60 family protein [Betaproteobacteria bacterium]
QAGDLVFYNTLKRPFSHVGICIGAGRFVHAPKSGAQVRLESIRGACRTLRLDRFRRIELGS